MQFQTEKPLLVEIKNIDEARHIVQSYTAKLSQIAQLCDEENIKKTKTLKSLLQSPVENNVYQGEKFTDAARKLQRAWRARNASHTLRTLNLKGNHAPEVNLFVNNQAILMHPNRAKQETLLDAYRNKHWTHEIFIDPGFQELALGLFARDKLKATEFETLLILSYARKSMDESVKRKPVGSLPIQFFSILDSNHQFTEEANALIIPNLKNFKRITFDDTRIENLRLLCQAFFEIYPSENMFGMVASNDLLRDPLNTTFFKDFEITMYHPDTRLKLSEVKNSLKTRPVLEKLFYSCTLHDALKLSWSTVQNVFPLRSVAGFLSKSDIEKYTTKGFRPSDVSFNNVPRDDKIHGVNLLHDFTRREHDEYHSIKMSLAGHDFLKITNRFKKIVRDLLAYSSLNSEQSLHIWKLIDAEFAYFYKPLNEPLETLFDNVFSYKNIRFDDNFSDDFISNDGLLDIAIALFIDMQINNNIWKTELNFNPENMKKFSEYFSIAKKISPHLTDSMKLNILLYRIFQNFGEETYQVIYRFIDKNINDISSLMQVFRNNETGFLGLIHKKIGKINNDSLSLFLVVAFMQERGVAIDYLNKYWRPTGLKKNNDFSTTMLRLCLCFQNDDFIINKCIFPVMNELIQAINKRQLVDYIFTFEELKKLFESYRDQPIIHNNTDILHLLKMTQESRREVFRLTLNSHCSTILQNEHPEKTITQEALIGFIVSAMAANNDRMPIRFDWNYELRNKDFIPEFKDIDFLTIQEILRNDHNISKAALFSIWRHALLKKIHFSGCKNIRFLNMCECSDCIFENCTFDRIDSSKIIDCLFFNVNFNKINIENVTINYTLFKECQFENCILENVRASEMHFEKCKINLSTFLHVNLIKSEYKNNDIDSKTTFKNTQWDVIHDKKHEKIRKIAPKVIMLYQGLDGCIEYLIRFYKKFEINIIFITPGTGLSHNIFEASELISGIIFQGYDDLSDDNDEDRKKLYTELLNFACSRKIPTLGIGGGHRLIGSHFNGTIAKLSENRGHLIHVKNKPDSRLYAGLNKHYEKLAAKKHETGLVAASNFSKDSQGKITYHSNYSRYFGVFFDKTRDKSRVKIVAKASDGIPEVLQIDGHILTCQHIPQSLMEDNTDKLTRSTLKQFVIMVDEYAHNNPGELSSYSRLCTID